MFPSVKFNTQVLRIKEYVKVLPEVFLIAMAC